MATQYLYAKMTSKSGLEHHLYWIEGNKTWATRWDNKKTSQSDKRPYKTSTKDVAMSLLYSCNVLMHSVYEAFMKNWQSPNTCRYLDDRPPNQELGTWSLDVRVGVIRLSEHPHKCEGDCIYVESNMKVVQCSTTREAEYHLVKNVLCGLAMKESLD